MSLPSKSATSKSGITRVNQSPEQAFYLPLFPAPLLTGVRSVAVQQPASAQRTNENVEPSIEENRNHDVNAPDVNALDVKALQEQYGELSHLVKEQARMSYQQSQDLQQQMARQAEHHQSKLRQLEQAWSHRLDTVIANTQKIANQTDAYKANAYQQMRSPAINQPEHQARLTDSRASQERKTPSPLSKVPTTYRVPRRSQARWLDKFLSAAPAVVGLIVVGTVIAALSAIAISPTVLWPSLSLVIQTVIPFIFVTGLISVGITAVWDAAR